MLLEGFQDRKKKVLAGVGQLSAPGRAHTHKHTPMCFTNNENSNRARRCIGRRAKHDSRRPVASSGDLPLSAKLGGGGPCFAFAGAATERYLAAGLPPKRYLLHLPGRG